MSTEIEFKEWFKVGDNQHGYEFFVVLIDERWAGGALGQCDDGKKTFFFFPPISENAYLGLKDKDRAILLTGAYAQALENGYGGIKRWTVPEELRGKPEDFRCQKCEEIGCNGQACDDDFYDDDFYAHSDDDWKEAV